jgi:purine-nucleoside/S-methyl-5'-thioadenosine phosphorylase / adenosine deaminase
MFIKPDWPAPPRIQAAMTLRTGGVSAAPFDALNMGIHVGDDPAAVAENRKRVRAALSLPSEPAWLSQVHGVSVADLDALSQPALRADAAVTREAGRVCVIQVADCMPVLFAARDGSAVGAAHAGWRGLAAGVLEATVTAMRVAPANLLAWLGPAIGQADFEVGDEVRDAFMVNDARAAEAFVPNARQRWQCDLYALARQRLTALGVRGVYGGEWSTYSEPERFFSFRRAARCGRMAALVWIGEA